MKDTETGKSLHLGCLPLSVSLLEQMLALPDGCKIVSLHYNEADRRLNIVLSSDELPEVKEYHPLPQVSLHVTMDTLPDHPGYKRLTTEITYL